MASKVLILRWAGSAYDSLGGFLDLTARQLASRGADVHMFTAGDENWQRRLVQTLGESRFAFALTMSGIGAELRTDGKLLWDVAKVPLFNWCCDHPCYYPSRHVIHSPYLMHGYVFPDHARYQIQHLKPNGVAYASLLSIPPRDIFSTMSDARNGRIMFAKTGADTNAIEDQWRRLAPYMTNILFAAAEELMHCQTAAFLPTVQRIAGTYGLFLDGNSIAAMHMLRELDAYIRFRRANLVVRAALAYPVDVFGSGWEHIEWEGAAARYHGPLSFQDMIERMPTYTACLSTNPLVDESVHDRVFFALAARVVPISDSNAFSRANLPGLEPYAFSFYPDSVVAAIDHALSDPQTALMRTEETWKSLAQPFGLPVSVGRILQFVTTQKLNGLAQ